ncbi:transglycosylase family protein [Streptomyces sp. NPDC053427]|uniref:transglycosylase family protein n=1 Tax=Streptomyces sp. NPDC053427 TaxID=3365701 RepID=UPI0037D54123
MTTRDPGYLSIHRIGQGFDGAYAFAVRVRRTAPARRQLQHVIRRSKGNCMRSGNGRHRRPRQAPALFVAAGVTGAGLALPLLGASGAHAADTATWDKVAQCESGGMWSAASGNGFYGGLQLTQEMWEQYGGTAYASRPDLASRAQQIAVAESILDDRGPDAWPSCAVNAGLTKDGRAPEVNPGSTSTPRPKPSDTADPDDPSGPSDEPSDGPSDEPSGGDADDATPSPSAPDATDPGDPSGPSDPSDPSRAGDEDGRQDGDGGPAAPETPAKGKHRGGADESPGGKGDGEGGKGGKGAGDADRPAGRHASRGGDDHRTDPGAEPGADSGADPSAPASDYTVRRGDTLSAIAQAHDLPGGWPALYERNEKVVGVDADLIRPGQLLDLGHAKG